MKIGIGTFFIILALLLFGIGKPKFSKEYEDYKSASHTISEGTVYLNGKVAPTTPNLIKDLVYGFKGEFTGFGKYNGFKPVELYEQTVPFITEDGKNISLVFAQPPHRGQFIIKHMLPEKTHNNTAIVLQGIRKNSMLNVLGEMKGDTLQVNYSYVDTPKAYKEFVEGGNSILNQVFAGLLATGLLFLFWGFLSRQKKKKHGRRIQY
ncbi:hypothetical protein [Algivirga pacifica]|uniref:Uncharacterized protein n=1 Tax=Algivirga pacifica TaxID=1162670 RepID=A0ABP9DFU7_9BACT